MPTRVPNVVEKGMSQGGNIEERGVYQLCQHAILSYLTLYNLARIEFQQPSKPIKIYGTHIRTDPLV